MCLLCLYRFSELLEAVSGNILFNGRGDVLSRTGFDIDVASTVKQKIAQNGLQSLGKVAKTQQTTGKNFQTLFRFLRTLHGKLPIYILDQLRTKTTLILRFG